MRISGYIVFNFKDYVTPHLHQETCMVSPLIAPSELRLTDLGLVDVGEFGLTK